MNTNEAILYVVIWGPAILAGLVCAILVLAIIKAIVGRR